MSLKTEELEKKMIERDANFGKELKALYEKHYPTPDIEEEESQNFLRAYGQLVLIARRDFIQGKIEIVKVNFIPPPKRDE